MVMRNIIGLTLLSLLMACNETSKVKPAWTERKGSCEDVVRDDGVHFVTDRYVYTRSNRYKVNDNDNIVVGDSICVYVHRYENSSYDEKYVKSNTKSIRIYEY